MNDKRTLQNALKKIQRYVKTPILRSLTFDSIEARLLDWYLARLSHSVQPSYFPFASDSTGVLCAYLKPGIDLLASPIVYVDLDLRNAHFVCESFKTLPTGLWLWVAH